MLESSWTKTEDRIVEILAKYNGLEAKTLHEKITRTHKISLQGLYDILGKLISAHALLKKGRLYLLSHEWAYRLKALLESHSPSLPHPGESFRFSFKNLTNSEAFWKSLFYATLDQAPKDPVFISVPHPIWGSVPGRNESDVRFQKLFQIQERHVYYTVMHESILGRKIIETMRSPVLHIQVSKMPQVKDQHTVVVGDFIIITKLSNKAEQRLGKFFADKTATPQDLECLLSRISKVAITIANNPKRAQELRAYLGREFIVKPKEK